MNLNVYELSNHEIVDKNNFTTLLHFKSGSKDHVKRLDIIN